MKKMIITGVNGFIGRCAMEYFGKDYEITGIDLADRYCEDGAEIHYYQCNMSKDSQELANIFSRSAAGCNLTLCRQCKCRSIDCKSDGGLRWKSAQLISAAFSIAVI